MSLLTLTNHNQPDKEVKFQISGSYFYYLAVNFYIYNPETKEVIAEINKMNSVKDIDEIKFGHSVNSLAFIKDIAQLDIKNRRKPNLDGNFFYIPLGYQVDRNSYIRRGGSMFTRHKIKACSFYLPITALTSFKLVNKGEKVNNFTKELFKRFRMEMTDSMSGEKFVITGKCNNTVVDLNKNKEMVTELKDIVSGVHSYKRDFKITPEWKEDLMENLGKFVDKYSNYEVQQ